MLVRATDTGFYKGVRIRPGQEFEVPDGTKGKWFVPASTSVPAAPKEEAEPVTLSAIAKATGPSKSKKVPTDDPLA